MTGLWRREECEECMEAWGVCGVCGVWGVCGGVRSVWRRDECVEAWWVSDTSGFHIQWDWDLDPRLLSLQSKITDYKAIGHRFKIYGEIYRNLKYGCTSFNWDVYQTLRRGVMCGRTFQRHRECPQWVATGGAESALPTNAARCPPPWNGRHSHSHCSHTHTNHEVSDYLIVTIVDGY